MQVFQAISTIKGQQFARIVYSCKESQIPKKVFGEWVSKRVSAQIQIGGNYENAVNNHLEKQGDNRTFVSQPLKWGQWLKGFVNRVIEHNGNYYLRCSTPANAKIVTEYFINGVAATDVQVSTIKAIKAAKSQQSGTQAAAGLTDNQVKVFDIAFGNIEQITCNGKTIAVSQAI